jgi:hypothetical protein
VLLIGGISVWAVYGIVWLTGAEPDVRAFLPFHLGGVIPGSLVTRWDAFRRFFSQSHDQDHQGA